MSSIKRRPHILAREKSLAMPRHIIFFDTETTQKELPNGSIEQKLRLGWACYYQKSYGRHREQKVWHYFTEAVDFWAFVYSHTKRKRKLWLIARNVDFDFTILQGWHYLRQVGFKLKFFHSSGVTTVISVKSRHGSIIFVDSLNWFRESLQKTGKRIGLPKLSIDFETCSEKELIAYCRRDVEIELENFKLFVKFLEDNQISRLRYTIGSTALSAFLFAGGGGKIYIHNNEQAIELERDSFRGGRVECFYIGEKTNERLYILDVNSLYPAVMHNSFYPVRYRKIVTSCSPDTLRNRIKTFAAIAQVLIETDEPAYAVRRNYTIFPVGCFWVTLTTPELQYAFARGHVKEVRRAVFYKQIKLFEHYVERFYKLRRKFESTGRGDYAEICKLLLNSLYGKFGQKADVWEKVGDCPGEPDRIEVTFRTGGLRATQIRYLLGEVFELIGFEECFNSFPAIASHVTAYGRMYLYELMNQAGQGNYFYCDTDSLIVNEVGLCNLENRIDSVSLGSLKVQEQTNYLNIRGLKDYSTEKKQVVKGIRKNAVELSDGVYEQELWPSLKGLLREHQSDTYTVKKTTKILQRKYNKGTVSSDGIVSPLALDDSYLSSELLY
jgi:hypothetical protein